LVLALGSEKYEYSRTGFDDPCFSSAETRPLILRLVGTKTVCARQIASLEHNPSLANADYVFVANFWSEETVKGFAPGLALLRTLTKAHIILVGQNEVFPTFDKSLRFVGAAQLRGLNAQMFVQRSVSDERINDELRRLASANGLTFIDRQPLVCSDSAAQCEIVDAGGDLLYRDVSHWSYEGRKVFGARMAKAVAVVFEPTANH
jgi:hypothetical protein